ncbi:MAG TPA: GNAT family N-acetyltransferase [Kineosporiaceae bacterium]|nr:GNAT family N-acetyltransferase [Kineosporiaceae bacterium]
MAGAERFAVEEGVSAAGAVDTLTLDHSAWRRFVAGRPEATCFHRPEWAALLADCYRYPAFVVAQRGGDGEVLAGVPIAQVGRPGRPPRWLALPFSDECGPLTGPRGSVSALLAGVDALRRRRGADDLVVRADVPAPVASAEVAVVHELALPTAGGGARPRSSVRRAVAAARRNGVRVRVASTEEDLTGAFYRLHLRTRRRQGVPVQPRRYFRLLWERMIAPGHGIVLLADVDGTDLAGAVYLTGGTTVTYKYGASDERAWSLRPNHAVMAQAITWAAEEGYATFDFGRTDLDNPGLIRFKETWGARGRPLRYTSFAGRSGYGGGRRSQQLAAPVIRRSPPLVCRCLGELLYRYVP